MTTHQEAVLGLFKTEKDALEAISGIKEKGWQVIDAHTPIPSTAINAALIKKKSRVGWFTLTGGICGFFSGFALAIFTATRWNLIVSGKPIISLIPFFIVGFEFTILFAVIGNVLGLLTQVDLPAKYDEKLYHPDCSGDAYGIVAAASPDDIGELKALVVKMGGRIPGSVDMDGFQVTGAAVEAG